MFHPVGSQPPSVYWRRRLIVLGALVIVVVLLAVTISALTSSSSGAPSAQGSDSPVAAPRSTARSTSTPTSTARSTAPSTDRHGTRTTSGTDSPAASDAAVAPTRCAMSDLAVAAVVGQTSYQVGQKPTVELQVTNDGPSPCVQDLADKQVLLKVYNGESRVWGSHDCETQPGTDKHTLAVGAPVRVSVDWSGTTSEPKCAGRRQQVGAGTYTLYATLSGKTGRAARFTIT